MALAPWLRPSGAERHPNTQRPLRPGQRWVLARRPSIDGSPLGAVVRRDRVSTSVLNT